MATPWLSDLALAAGAAGVGVAMSFATEDGVTPANVIFGAILVAIFFVGVRSAVRAAQRAAAQRRVADQWASASPTEAVVPAVRTESERLYADVRSTLHVALEEIANAASRARVISPGQSSASDTVAIEALRAIQRHARIATTELHRMLGLLRTGERQVENGLAGREPRLNSTDHAHVDSRWAAVPSWPPSWGWILLYVVLLAEFLYFAVIWEGGLVQEAGQNLPRAVMQITLTCLAALIFFAPIGVALANAMTAAIFALGLVLDVPVVLDVWALVTFGVLTWRTITRPARQPWASLALVALMTVVLVGEARIDWVTFWFVAVFFTIAVMIALVARVADGVHASAQHRAVVAQESLSATTDAALRRHRSEVGRDLHDALSGTIGVLITQAGAAELLWHTDSRRALEALAVVTASVDHARDDLEHLASLVAPEQCQARGLADVPELVERLRGASLDIGLSPGLPVVAGQLDTAAYRIIQESLSNAALHAPGSRVEVSIVVTDGWLRIDVADNGVGGASGVRGGFGLVGLRERAQQLGGHVNTEATAAGFRVRAKLPLVAEVVT